MTIDPDTSLAELVTAHPTLAITLGRHRLDYCCRGDRTLARACAEEGVDGEAVLAELRVALAGDTGSAPWATMGIAELVDHLEDTHHRYLHETMPLLGDMVEKVRAAHGARHPELDELAATYATLRAELEPHLRKEEQVLFPMIRELAVAETVPTFGCGSIANPISVMLAEHDRAGELLERLHRLTDGYRVPQDGCTTYRACYASLAELEADTHLHVHKENHHLFPGALAAEEQLTASA